MLKYIIWKRTKFKTHMRNLYIFCFCLCPFHLFKVAELHWRKKKCPPVRFNSNQIKSVDNCGVLFCAADKAKYDQTPHISDQADYLSF